MPLTVLKEFTDKECCKGENCNKCTLIEYVDTHTACKNAFLAVSGLSVHNVSFRLFKTESKSRNTVCYKVDEQKVNGLENCEVKDCCGED